MKNLSYGSSGGLRRWVYLCLLCYLPLSATSWFKVSGFVTDLKGRSLENTRIQVLVKHGPQSTLKGVYVVYSNEKGDYSIDFPQGETICLSATGRACKSFETLLKTPDVAGGIIPLDITLQDGLSDIPIGSLDQAQLHVYPSDQRAIDRYISENLLERIPPYISYNISDPHRQRWAYRLTGHILFIRELKEEAKRFFSLGDTLLYGNLNGNSAFGAKRFSEALESYRQSENSSIRAKNLLTMADHFDAQTRDDLSIECRQLAMVDYSRLSNSLLFDWSTQFSDHSALSKEIHLKFAKSSPKSDLELDRLLRLAQHYCLQLEKLSIYYFCSESKHDRIGSNDKLRVATEYPVHYFGKSKPYIFPLKQVVLDYKYDLQLIQEGNGTIEEKRKLLSKHVDEQNILEIYETYDVNKALFGPNAMISRDVQSHFFYTLIGEETLFGEQAAIIEAVPKWFIIDELNAGKVWVNKRDGSILKIERHIRRIVNRTAIRRRALILDMEPQVIFSSEYGFVNHGFWYPSKNQVLEIYGRAGQATLTRLDIESNYTGYQFFGVGTEYSIEDLTVGEKSH